LSLFSHWKTPTSKKFSETPECGQAPLKTSWFKKGCVKCSKMCITVHTTLALKLRVLLRFADTVKELAGYPAQNCPSGSFLFLEGGLSAGREQYDNV
jgi:hypothetical protein